MEQPSRGAKSPDPLLKFLGVFGLHQEPVMILFASGQHLQLPQTFQTHFSSRESAGADDGGGAGEKSRAGRH